jgi:hypothetical protein
VDREQDWNDALSTGSEYIVHKSYYKTLDKTHTCLVKRKESKQKKPISKPPLRDKTGREERKTSIKGSGPIGSIIHLPIQPI